MKKSTPLIEGKTKTNIKKSSTTTKAAPPPAPKVTCQKHKKIIDNYNGSLKDLSVELGDLHYEALAQFLEDFRKKILADGKKDSQAGRKQLGLELHVASHYLKLAKLSIERAWKISKPYMKK